MLLPLSTSVGSSMLPFLTPAPIETYYIVGIPNWKFGGGDYYYFSNSSSPEFTANFLTGFFFFVLSLT
jgi:hypothetical protein